MSNTTEKKYNRLNHFIPEGDTASNREDLYDDIDGNLNHLCSLAQVAQIAHTHRDVDPSVMASYCNAMLEITHLLSLRIQNLRKEDAMLES